MWRSDDRFHGERRRARVPPRPVFIWEHHFSAGGVCSLWNREVTARPREGAQTGIIAFAAGWQAGGRRSGGRASRDDAHRIGEQ